MITTVADGLDHPECVAVGVDGGLYAGGEAGQIYRIDPVTGSSDVMGATGGFVLGVTLDANGNVYACDPGLGGLVRIAPDGTASMVSRTPAGHSLTTPNYAVFDFTGALYLSDSGTWLADDGCVLRLGSDGSTEVWSRSASRFTNGMALHPDGDSLYIAESTLPGVSRIPILPDGSAGELEIVAMMPGTVPDGLAFDITGRLYIACYRPDRIYTLETDGRLLVLADDFQGTALAAPTNVAFGGPDGRDLYIASLARWHVGKIRVPDPGQSLHYPTTLIPMEDS